MYVDDIIVTENDEKEKNTLKQCLANEFEIKDLGKFKYFFGIEVARSKQGIFISQQKYVIDLLRETGMMARSNLWFTCAVPRNSLGQHSQCLTFSQYTKRAWIFPTLILLTLKIQDSLANAPTWSRC